MPGKNLASFRGRPLVVHAVVTAIRAGIGRVVVTTDDPAIAETARSAGAEVIRRPAELATAEARTLPAVLHALDASAEPDETLVVLLQPTSPLRTAQDIEDCLDLHGGRRSGSVIQMTESGGHHPLKACLVTASGIRPVREWADLEAPRRQLPPVARPTGGIYLVRAADLRRHQRFFVPEVRAQFVPPERAVDIDTAEDLRLAEQIAQRSTNSL